MKMFKLGLGLVVLVAVGYSAMAGDGSSIYSSKCISCHGKDAKGNPAMAKMFKVPNSALDLTDKETLDKKDEDLMTVTSKGKGKMPGFAGKLKDEEITGVISYMRSMGSSPAKEEKKKEKKAESKPASVDLAAAAKLFGGKCATCHGKDAKGSPVMVKMFKADPAVMNLTSEKTLGETDEALFTVISKGRGKMPAYGGKIKDEEIHSLIAYLRSLK
ncbi:MAG: c-type cytochrome [Elusimicrobia bacterium]|nr:c-type cytochrome [Elusimicrobiota bacterium]